MPIKKSAFKELRKAKKRHPRNSKVLSELKTLNKKFINLLNEKSIEQAKKILIQLIVKLDKAASKKIIHKNKASRKKSRLMRLLNADDRRLPARPVNKGAGGHTDGHR